MVSSFYPGAFHTQSSTESGTNAVPFLPPNMMQTGMQNSFNIPEFPMGQDMMGFGSIFGGMGNGQNQQGHSMMPGHPMEQGFQMNGGFPMEKEMMEREMMEREIMERVMMEREKLEMEMMRREMAKEAMNEEEEEMPLLLKLIFYVNFLLGTGLDLRSELAIENVLGLVSVIEMLTMIDDK